jgi:hypothetical protein
MCIIIIIDIIVAIPIIIIISSSSSSSHRFGRFLSCVGHVTALLVDAMSMLLARDTTASSQKLFTHQPWLGVSLGVQVSGELKTFF